MPLKTGILSIALGVLMVFFSFWGIYVVEERANNYQQEDREPIDELAHFS